LWDFSPFPAKLNAGISVIAGYGPNDNVLIVSYLMESFEPVVGANSLANIPINDFSPTQKCRSSAKLACSGTWTIAF
jgi:hypothetical protein